MMRPAKILAVDDEPDFELLIRQRFRRQIRAGEFAFRFAHHGEEALAVLARGARHRADAARHQHAGDGRADPACPNCGQRQSPVRAIIVSAYGDMANIRTAMNRGAFDFVTKPVDLNDLEITDPQDARRDRPRARARPPARRRRAGPHQSFALFLAEPRRDAGRPGRAARRGAARRPWPCCSSTSSASPAWPRRMAPEAVVDDAARVSRADDGADLRLRRHRREIHRRRDLRGVRGAERGARTTPPTRCAAPSVMLAALDDWNARARAATASRRSRSASASITGRRCSAMSAASTACPSP